jgi:hypothetical protein
VPREEVFKSCASVEKFWLKLKLVYNSVHIAIAYRLAIIDPPAIDHI